MKGGAEKRCCSLTRTSSAGRHGLTASSSCGTVSEMPVHVPMAFGDAGGETAPFRKTLGGCDER